MNQTDSRREAIACWERQAQLTSTLTQLLAKRRSVRRLISGSITPELLQDLVKAAQYTPSAFNSQPWQVVLLYERHAAFWDMTEATIRARLTGERQQRYLARAAGMRAGVLTLVIFENLAQSAPRPGLAAGEMRDQTSQALGMLQLSLWLTLTAHGFVTSLQHWHAFLEDAALAFCKLPAEGFRLVAFLPVGQAQEPPPTRSEQLSKVSFEQVQEADDGSMP